MLKPKEINTSRYWSFQWGSNFFLNVQNVLLAQQDWGGKLSGKNLSIVPNGEEDNKYPFVMMMYNWKTLLCVNCFLEWQWTLQVHSLK